MPGRSAIGLDIGTSAVRAAQLTDGPGGVTLERFGEVPLPPGAVRDGEVAEPGEVVPALKQLWREHGLKGRKVVLGVANQNVVVRQVDLPWAPPAQLRASLPGQLQQLAPDLIPMPSEAAVADVHVVTESADEAGNRTLHGLLVAASRDMVRSTVGTAEAAGLRPVAVDLSAFALIRALAWPSPSYPVVPTQTRVPEGDRHSAELPAVMTGPPPAEVEAIVDVGAAVTNVVVHRSGVPLFVRILLRRGHDTVAEVDDDSLHDEVRGSLDDFASSSGYGPVSRILLSGGGARTPGMAARLSAVTHITVDYSHALAGLNVAGVRMPAQQLAYLEPAATVALGLARGALT